MQNGSVNISLDIGNAPRALFISLYVVSCWDVLTNGLVLLCIVFNRHALKKIAILQILTLSVTDTLLGATFITLVTSFDRTKEYSFWSCSMLWYPYVTATFTSIYHTLSVCIHRLLSIKRMSGNSEINSSKMYKRVVIQIAVPWAIGFIFVGIVFLSFGNRRVTIKECSLTALFDDNYVTAVSILNVACIIPHLATNIIYFKILKFLLRKWNRIGTMRHRNTQSTTSRREANVSIENTRQVNVGASSSRSGVNLAVDNIRQINAGETTSKRGINLFEWNRVKNNRQVHTETTPTRRGAALSEGNIFTLTDEKTENKTNKARALNPVNTENTVNERHNVNRRQNPVKRISSNVAEQKDVFITIGVLLITLNISIIPVLLMPLVDLLTDQSLSLETKAMMALMPLLNSLINPIIYIVRVKTFREALRHSFLNLCGKLGSLLNH